MADITLCYNYGRDKEFVFSCKNRPFAVLCSSSLPTPAATLIDHNLVMELGLKMSDLQCKKISFAGKKLRLLGKISTTVQCIKNGKMFANLHLRASVVENLKGTIDSHCIAGVKMSQMLSATVPSLDDVNKDDQQKRRTPVPTTPSASSVSSSASSQPTSGTPSSTGLSPIILSDAAAAAKCTPTSRVRTLVIDEGWSPLTANLTAIDEMFGGADIMSDDEEEKDILDKHKPLNPKLVYLSGHGCYKCNRVQCDVTDNPWKQVPDNCGFHPAYSIPDEFDFCGEDCCGAFCRCLKFYQTE